MKLKSLLFASATSLAFIAAASAQDNSGYKGFYGSIGAGLTSITDDTDFESLETSGAPFDSDIDYDNGIGIVTALGYDWGNSWRTELEFSYRSNDADDIATDNAGFSGFPSDGLNGDLDSYSLFANLLYDFDYVKNYLPVAITPYIGGGVGGSIIDLELNGSNPTAISGLTPFSLDDNVTALAYQGIAGLVFDLAENVALDVSYRYHGTDKRTFDGATIGNNISVPISTTPNSHNIFASLRWNFGAPAAVAPPAPAPTPQYKDCWDGSSVPVSASCPTELVEEVAQTPDPIQTIVYFDYDKSNLTAASADLIAETVRRARQFDVERVSVIGNTDTSGSSAYNQALSERRARVVRDALIAQGIPSSIISTNAQGENNLAKSTADGVREPLNRRTEITIRFE